MRKLSYNIDKYDFVSEIEKLYDICDLENIHNQWSEAKKYDILDDVEFDQDTVYHSKFYNEIENTKFYQIYKSFIKEFIKPIFDGDILYQAIPTFRVHQPNNLAVAEFHRDSDYSHSIHEINFFLPLTDAYGNNTIWAETKKDKKDFQPMEAEVGEMWMWNGATLLHGNKLNDTGTSRVSFDFRILPLDKYKENNKTTLTNKTQMIIGDYWKCL